MKKIYAFVKEHRVRLLLNLLAWFFIGNATCNNSRNYVPAHNEQWRYIAAIICFNLFYVAAVSVHNLWILPKTLFRRKVAIYVIALLLHLLVWSVLLTCYTEYLHSLFPQTPQHCFSAFNFGRRENFETNFEYISSVMAGMFFLMFLFGTGLMAQRFFIVNRQKELLRQKQQEAELSLLKSQINPHFLFNVLNSIYALSLKKSDYAPEMVLKLSDLLRYMLYETRQELVSLEKEIRWMSDYLEIEKMRINDPQAIVSTINGDTHKLMIAPLILLPFVENAVKHGIDSVLEAGFLHISVDIQEGKLLFRCSNNYRDSGRPATGGIGLENVRKRLELLYANRYELHIDDTRNIFTVTLDIKLNV